MLTCRGPLKICFDGLLDSVKARRLKQILVKKNSYLVEKKRFLPLEKLKSNVLDGFENSSSNGSNVRTLGENGSTASSTLFALLFSNGPGNELPWFAYE